MLAYTRRQIVLLFVVVAVGAGGLAIDRWRRGNPDVVAYLESLDRAPAPTTTALEPVARRPPAPTTPPRSASVSRGAAVHHESARARHVRVEDGMPLDLNLASAADFERLPGVGRALAARIVDVRTREGPFGSVDDLRRVRGVGEATLERLRPRLAVNTP
ncbi:MAG TPA: ComEA family DNA-binding protein [Methylomirabilota bacterium]